MAEESVIGHVVVIPQLQPQHLARGAFHRSHQVHLHVALVDGRPIGGTPGVLDGNRVVARGGLGDGAAGPLAHRFTLHFRVAGVDPFYNRDDVTAKGSSDVVGGQSQTNLVSGHSHAGKWQAIYAHVAAVSKAQRVCVFHAISGNDVHFQAASYIAQRCRRRRERSIAFIGVDVLQRAACGVKHTPTCAPSMLRVHVPACPPIHRPRHYRREVRWGRTTH